jgi:hypothetical protein
MALTKAEKARMRRAGLTRLNKPKFTPRHKTKKAVVAVEINDKLKIIRFGAQGMGHNYSPEARRSFILLKENLHQHFGLINFYGQALVVVQNYHLNPKNTLKD